MAIQEINALRKNLTIADYGPAQSNVYALNQAALEELLKMGSANAIPPHTELFKVDADLPVLLRDPTFWVPPSKAWASFEAPSEYYTRRRALYDVKGMSPLFGSMRKQQFDLEAVRSLEELNDAQSKQKGVMMNFYKRFISKNKELEHIWGNMGRFRQA